MFYKNIIDPSTGKKISLKSNAGIKLIKKYIKVTLNGGVDNDWTLKKFWDQEFGKLYKPYVFLSFLGKGFRFDKGFFQLSFKGTVTYSEYFGNEQHKYPHFHKSDQGNERDEWHYMYSKSAHGPNRQIPISNKITAEQVLNIVSDILEKTFISNQINQDIAIQLLLAISTIIIMDHYGILTNTRTQRNSFTFIQEAQELISGDFWYDDGLHHRQLHNLYNHEFNDACVNREEVQEIIDSNRVNIISILFKYIIICARFIAVTNRRQNQTNEGDIEASIDARVSRYLQYLNDAQDAKILIKDELINLINRNIENSKSTDDEDIDIFNKFRNSVTKYRLNDYVDDTSKKTYQIIGKKPNESDVMEYKLIDIDSFTETEFMNNENNVNFSFSKKNTFVKLNINNRLLKFSEISRRSNLVKQGCLECQLNQTILEQVKAILNIKNNEDVSKLFCYYIGYKNCVKKYETVPSFCNTVTRRQDKYKLDDYNRDKTDIITEHILDILDKLIEGEERNPIKALDKVNLFLNLLEFKNDSISEKIKELRNEKKNIYIENEELFEDKLKNIEERLGINYEESKEVNLGNTAQGKRRTKKKKNKKKKK